MLLAIAKVMNFFRNTKNFMPVLFYIMLLTLSLDSAFVWVETLISRVDKVLGSRDYKGPI